MKQLLLYSAIVFFFLSCNKTEEKPDPVDPPMLTQTQTSLMAHVWLFDSIKTDQPGEAGVIEPDPKMEISFKASVYDVFMPGTPPVTNQFRYEIEASDKMYYWLEVNGKDTSKYTRIETLTNKAWVVSSPSGTYRVYEYYHAK